MKRNYLTAAVVLIALITALPLWAGEQVQAPAPEDYTIGPGDVLEISVWQNEALTKMLKVLPDGKIHFPLIGEVVVGGKTLADLETEMKQRIDVFVPDPVISVMVREISSMFIYIIGEVNSPGRFGLNSNINVLQALCMAGGFNEWAKKNKIKIFRETKGKTEVLRFSYDDMVKEKNIDSNITLKRGDIIFVPY